MDKMTLAALEATLRSYQNGQALQRGAHLASISAPDG
ncbi:MAG: hypothetical protein R2911_31440 [Caldilineaceae bacterium]